MAHILVVDDDLAMRGIVADALRQDGYAVDTAGNGLQALTAFRRHRPDVLVLDLGMPAMDGPTLMRTLREQTRWGGVPVVVISGQARAQAVGGLLGATACLDKPLDLPRLLDAIEAIASP